MRRGSFHRRLKKLESHSGNTGLAVVMRYGDETKEQAIAHYEREHGPIGEVGILLLMGFPHTLRPD